MSLHKIGLPGLSCRKLRFVAHALGMSDLPPLPASVARRMTRRPADTSSDTCALAAALSEVQSAAEVQKGLGGMSDCEVVLGDTFGKRRTKIHLRGEVSIALTKVLSMLCLSEFDRACISSVTLRTVSGDAKLELRRASVRVLVVAAPLGPTPQNGREEIGGVWWHSCADGDGQSPLGPFLFALQNQTRKDGTVLQPETVIQGRYTDISSSGDAAGASLCPLLLGGRYLFRPPNLTYADTRSPSFAVLEPRSFILCTLCFSDAEAATCSIQLQKLAAGEPGKGIGISDSDTAALPEPKVKQKRRNRPSRMGHEATERQRSRAKFQRQRADRGAADASPARDEQPPRPPSPPSLPPRVGRLAMGVRARSRTPSLSQTPTQPQVQVQPPVQPHVQVRGRGVGASGSMFVPAADSNAPDGGVATEVLRGRRR